MDKSPVMVIVERSTPISKKTYYFTKNDIFRLEAYSNLLSYFLLLCLILLIYRTAQGLNIVSVVIAAAIIAFLFVFMILWVYPKERRISNFSLAELKKESSAKRMQWKDISKVTLRKKNLTFSYMGKMQNGKVKNNPTDAIKLFRSKLAV